MITWHCVKSGCDHTVKTDSALTSYVHLADGRHVWTVLVLVSGARKNFGGDDA